MIIIFRKDKNMFSSDSMFAVLPEILSNEPCCSVKAWSEVAFMGDMPLLSLNTNSW